jgi:murein DD-endopeptidase MepM/ murein hydrolase activator NlpD
VTVTGVSFDQTQATSAVRNAATAATRHAARFPSASFRRLLDEVRPAQVVERAEEPCHTVRAGDSLWSICRNTLSEQGHTPSNRDVHLAVKKVVAANGLSNPDLILPGQEIDLSALSSPGDSETRILPAYNLTSPPPLMPRTEETVTLPMPRAVVNQYAVQSTLGGDTTGTVESAAELPDKPTSPWARLLDGSARLTSEYGMRRDPFTGELRHHDGIDIAARPGTPVHPYLPGRVVFSGWKEGYGQTVVVRHREGLETVYGHTARNLVREGQKVGPGMAIGLVGSTGRSTGPHLHFEVRRNGRSVDPVQVLTGSPLQVAQVF